jgi:hypothetical protein
MLSPGAGRTFFAFQESRIGGGFLALLTTQTDATKREHADSIRGGVPSISRRSKAITVHMPLPPAQQVEVDKAILGPGGDRLSVDDVWAHVQ